MSCWRYFGLCMSVNLQHDTLTCRVGGLPTNANTKYLQHDIPFYTSNMCCWFTNIHNTKYLQHDIPLVCRVCSHLSTIVVSSKEHFLAVISTSVNITLYHLWPISMWIAACELATLIKIYHIPMIRHLFPSDGIRPSRCE